MPKKILIIFFCGVTAFLMTGCTDTKAIDKASLVQSITADYAHNETVYTFRIYGSEDDISIKSKSLKQACLTAKEKYIPNMAVSKLEILLINENLYRNSLKNDIDYLSLQSEISPNMYVSVCDSGFIELFTKTKDSVKSTENSIILLKKNNPKVKVSLLSIFNSIHLRNNENICLSFINSKKEINTKIIHNYAK